jgi:dienelactone hydrolase
MRSTPGLLTLLAWTALLQAGPSPIFPEGTKPKDRRLGPVRTLRNTDFDFQVPPSLEAWKNRREELREQVLVALGLWPMPPRTPLKPTIHGLIKREGYTVEKVFFASLPGHYVSGNLYRPTGSKGKKPGVLCPHGHWANGRFFDAGLTKAQQEIDKGAEKTLAGARYPLQARCAQLARMGCVVFHYDMVGYADSKAIAHRAGFTDAEAALRLQNFMGLQTWNSIRSLDFLLSLPDVDTSRIGVTGASGGGTQTFILGAVDDRPDVAFPAVMVSTQMQGGCICENGSYLRQGTGNVELAALFAPKPLAMSGADDWTIHIEDKGLPELKTLYKLYDAEEKVSAHCFPAFKHNYNQVSREVMYNWFNKYLGLGLPEPVREKPFEPIPPGQLSVYSKDHLRPKDEVGAPRLRQYLTEVSDRQINALKPKDQEGLKEYRRILGTALRVLMHDRLPGAGEVEGKFVGDEVKIPGGGTVRQVLLGRKGKGEQVPALLLNGHAKEVVVWVHPEGKASLFREGKLIPEARQVLARGAGLLALDCFGTGELIPKEPRTVNSSYCGYTFAYNRPLLAERIHDILTAVAYARGAKDRKVSLVGFAQAGPWVALARGLCGESVARTAADLDGFRFEKVTRTDDPMMLPGALKYGGLPALAALAAPGELFLHNQKGTGARTWIEPVYRTAGAAKQYHGEEKAIAASKVVEWLLR